MITIYKTKTGDSAIYCSWPLLFSLESSYIFPLCLDLIEDLHPFHTLIQWIQIPDTTWSSHSSRVVHLFHIVCSFMQSFCQPLVQIHFPCTFIENKWNITFSLPYSPCSIMSTTYKIFIGHWPAFTVRYVWLGWPNFWQQSKRAVWTSDAHCIWALTVLMYWP